MSGMPLYDGRLGVSPSHRFGIFVLRILLSALTYNPALAGVLIVFEAVIAWALYALLACVPYEIRRITRRSQ